jgi:hypothetical protein
MRWMQRAFWPIPRTGVSSEEPGGRAGRRPGRGGLGAGRDRQQGVGVRRRRPREHVLWRGVRCHSWAAGCQFSSVQLGLSSCVFGLVQFATRAFRAAGMAYVLSRCCPATRILLLKIRDSLARGNPMLADRSAIRDLSCPRIPTSQEDVSHCLNPRYADHITTIL